jgi:hypothetical protein
MWPDKVELIPHQCNGNFGEVCTAEDHVIVAYDGSGNLTDQGFEQIGAAPLNLGEREEVSPPTPVDSNLASMTA